LFHAVGYLIETVCICPAQVTDSGPFREHGTVRIETNAKPAPSSVKIYDRLLRHVRKREEPFLPSMAALPRSAEWQLDATGAAVS
jgi:hypothetical protein